MQFWAGVSSWKDISGFDASGFGFDGTARVSSWKDVNGIDASAHRCNFKFVCTQWD